MDIINTQGRLISQLPYPLLKAGKALRQICSTQTPNVVFVFRDDMAIAVAKICRHHEIEYNKIVKERDIVPVQHFAQILAHEESLVIFKNVTPLTYRIKSFKDALEVGEANMVKSIVAQLIAIMIHAHEKDPRFTHNDFKADNILITSSSDYVIIGPYEIKSFGAKVVLIDFETTTGLLFPPFSHNKKLMQEFGISLPFSQWTDLHLIFMEVVRHKTPGFSDFLKKYFPLEIFTPNGQFVTSQNRLNELGREAMSSVQLKDLLQDTFFNS
jgi:serine/threonine protein kinase